MANENNGSFDVLEMASEYAQNTGVDVSELFKSPVTQDPKPEENETHTPESNENTSEPEAPKQTTSRWTPDASLIKDMPELQKQTSGVVYSKDEYQEEEDTTLVNQADEDTTKNGINALRGMEREAANIEFLKKRHNIKYFKIPPGPWQVKMTTAASDENTDRAQAALDKVLEELKVEGPECIIYEQPATDAPEKSENEASAETPNDDADSAVSDGTEEIDESSPADVQIRIDKTKVPDLQFSEEELRKIKYSRKIELDIVEGFDIDYASIENADENLLDIALAPYKRKSHDIEAALPASNYRGVFTGLTYAEVLDLKAASDISGLDAEYKKWTVAFEHLKNPSIGPFEEYRWYIDPDTHRRVKLTMTEKAPSTLREDTVIHTCSKFEDFLRKTSFMDLEYMLWKVLCATASDKEMLNIVCHAPYNGQQCNNSYDWIYNPAELLVESSVSSIVLEAAEKTMKASSNKEIMDHYNESMLVKQNTVLLPTSGMRVVFGHVSAYDYLTSIFTEWEKLTEMAEDKNEMSKDYTSKVMIYTIAMTVKAFLIPTEGGKWKKVTGIDNIVYMMSQMDVVDISVLANIAQMMTNPYQMQFSLRDVKCPRCHGVRDIAINSIQDMLFILARSLSNVNVVLKTV